MKVLEDIKHLRAHLLRNWDVAHEWITEMWASNGSGCFIAVYNSPTGDFNKLNAAMGCPDQGSYFYPYDLLYKRGREGVLLEFDRAIARLEEHAEVPSGSEPLPELVSA